MNDNTPMRNPIGHRGSYQDYFSKMGKWENEWEARFADLPPSNKTCFMYSTIDADKKFLLHQYGAGFELEAIISTLKIKVPRILNAGDYVRIHRVPPQFQDYLLRGNSRLNFGYITLALLLLNDAEVLRQILLGVSPQKELKGYLFDLMLHAYDPLHRVATTYKKDKYLACWADPVLRVLALPAEERSAAMEKHMQSWPRIVSPYGYKEKLDSPPWFDGHSCDLAYEIALAASLYDIDDTAFRNHPYYPRDLADYYRQHIRPSRDQWRPLYVGADLPITVPPPPKKADLAKSKRKSIARWVELVADGDIDATEAVLDATGKPRKIHDLQTLLHNLAESDLAIYADLKDDETLELQASDLSEKRGLGPFEGPPGPPYGPARCEATLAAWSAWLGERGYLLIDIDDKDSDWHAIVVNTVFHPELQQLSEQLGIPVRLHGADLNPNQE